MKRNFAYSYCIQEFDTLIYLYLCIAVPSYSTNCEGIYLLHTSRWPARPLAQSRLRVVRGTQRQEMVIVVVVLSLVGAPIPQCTLEDKTCFIRI